MKTKIFTLFIIAIFSTISLNTFAQVAEIVGVWKTIDDNTGEAKSHIQIFKATNGMYYGKIVKLLKAKPDAVCKNCKDELKNKPLNGLMIITEMKEDDGELEDGKILDPESGSFYYCTIWLDEDNKDILHVKGSLDSWGVAGRSQTWQRVK